MPKSKRNKLVTLSQAKKKGREHKEGLVGALRQALDHFEAVYVFEFDTMRNAKFKELREDLKDSSRFFMGSNKVLQVALGKEQATEAREGLHKCSQLLVGQRGLLLTNMPHEEVVKRIEEVAQADFARAGTEATETVELKEGPLEQFSHDMEPFLRKQGMPVRLNKGVIELLGDFMVCREGEAISPHGATILRLLGIQLAEFRIRLVARWTPEDFEEFPEPDHKAPSDLGKGRVDSVEGGCGEGGQTEVA